MDLSRLLEPQYFLITTGVALFSMYIVKHLISQPKNLPPGPTGLPLLGVLLKFIRNSSDPIPLFSSWADEYGEIMSLKLGPKLVVLLNSYRLVLEAFKHPDLQNRPKSQMVNEIIGRPNSGIIVAEGEVWRDHRKFTHSVFRELGVGKKSYEDTIRTEMDQLIRAIEEKRGSSFNPNILLGKAVSNVICTIMFGTQYTYDDYDFLKVLNFMNVFSRNLGGGGSILYLPIPGLAKVPFGVPKLMSKIISEFNDFAQAQIEAHERTIDPDNPRDYIDRYIIRMAQKKGTDSTLDQTNLRKSIMDLFFAGSDTTSTTLTWAILFMTAYPEVQSRVQAELDQVIGRDRNAKLDDRPNLPYTNAVLMEIQRKGAIVPLGLPHIAAAEVTLDGYTIPKDAIIMANLWKVFNDGNLWKNPDAFKPERFLNQAGELIKKDELIFFSTGRRECPGKQLARVEVFLAFTTLLHRFTMKKPPNSPPLSFKGILGIARSASPFEICAVPRD